MNLNSENKTRLVAIIGKEPTTAAVTRAIQQSILLSRAAVARGEQPVTIRPTMPIFGHGAQLSAKRLDLKDIYNDGFYENHPVDRVTRQQERRMAVKGAKRLNRAMMKDATAAELAVHRKSPTSPEDQALHSADARRAKRRTPSRVGQQAETERRGIHLHSHARQAMRTARALEKLGAGVISKPVRKSRAKAKPAEAG